MKQALARSATAIAATLASPAVAEVTALDETGFASRHSVTVVAPPARAWRTLLLPRRWWNGEHTYSGDAANMAIDARVGGCFCEDFPRNAGSPAGRIEHMRVIYVAPNAMLRMQGGLGPLQSEALSGVLTVTLKSEGSGTRITWEYVVGGFSRTPLKDMAPLVDQVLGEQLVRLKARIEDG